MEKSSPLVFGSFFFVVLVVLQSAYVSGEGPASSPRDYGECDPRRQVDIGNFTSCEMCFAGCRSSYTASLCLNSNSTGPHPCRCCAPKKPIGQPSVGGTTATSTSLPFLYLSLFSSFVLIRLFI
ncbi:hypothetical protein MKX03_017702 [Papaver bracteatum]|nr:hypothetical protein MKX03_017702 [Papaver bracteatum]